MKLEHEAGHEVYIDFAGKKLEIVDRETGEIKKVEVFVSYSSTQPLYLRRGLF